MNSTSPSQGPKSANLYAGAVINGGVVSSVNNKSLSSCGPLPHPTTMNNTYNNIQPHYIITSQSPGNTASATHV